MCLGVETTLSVLEAMKPYSPKVHFWTDSEVALAWIKNDKEWSLYVNNRVQKILTAGFPVSSWNHVSSGDNPADLATRSGKQTMIDTMKDFWQHGPAFLKRMPEHWPRASVFTTKISSAKKVYLKIIDETQNEFLDRLNNECPHFDALIKVVALIFRWRKPARFANNDLTSCNLRQTIY